MNQIERRDAGLAYIADNAVFEEMQKCKGILQKLNFIDRRDADGISKLVKELFGKSEGAFVNPPFFCDYGSHIEVGKNFFANYNVWLGGNTVVCPGVHIGSNVVIGAGSVVTKDIPDWSIAAGNPCKVIRSITEDDKRLLFHNEEIDDEAWADITSRMSF